MQARASLCPDYGEEEQRSGFHQKQPFNQNPETRRDDIQIAADWKCFSRHDETLPLRLISIIFGLCLHVTWKGNYLMTEA